MNDHAVARMARAALGLLFLYSIAAEAQRVSPEDVALEYFAALQIEGLPAATVRYLHPDALVEFKEMVMPLIENGDPILSLVFPEMTLEQVKALDPAELTRRFFGAIPSPVFAPEPRFDQMEIVGVVSEGDQRHVLARVTVRMGEASMTDFDVMSFVPFGDTWRMQLTGELRGVAAELRSSLPERKAR
jgi:hypothetical protein